MIRRAFSLALIGLSAVGCATSPKIDRLRDGESVRLVITRQSPDGVVGIRNASLGNNASAGAAGGGVVGGLWGLACGPFAILCVPMGAGIGALTGGAGGALVGATGSLSEDKATQLRSSLGRSMKSHDLDEHLRTNVVERARRHWDLASEAPNYQLTVELGTIELTSTRDEQITLVMPARASLHRFGVQPANAAAMRVFECSAPPANLAIWLDEHNDFVDTVLGNCMQQLAAQVVAEMTLR